MKEPFTQAELDRMFEYDRSTGNLFWRMNRNWKARKGSIAGHKGERGIEIMFSRGVGYMMAHRIIWCLVYGEWPPNLIDHIDDNRIQNLRDVSQAENLMNQAKFDYRRTATGVL